MESGVVRGKKGDEAQRGVIGTILVSSLFFPTTFAYETWRTQNHSAPFASERTGISSVT